VNCIVPENDAPFCVTVQCALFICALVRPAPIIEPLESNVLPTQAPDIVCPLGLVGDVVPAPHATVVKPATRMAITAERMTFTPEDSGRPGHGL
jgi:hypothetical protein